MASVDCTVCADRYRCQWIGTVFLVLLSPWHWGWAALAGLCRLFQQRSRSHQPRLCFLAGSRPVRRQTGRALERVLSELARFESKSLLDLIVVQDRVTRSDGEALRVAVQRTRRGGTTLLTVRLALHARSTCYGPEALAATLADTLVALYEREAQAAPVLEVLARTPREALAAMPSVAPSRTRSGQVGTTVMARARVNEEADGTVTDFKPRPGGPSSNNHA